MRILHILNHTYRLNGNVHAAIDVACAQAGSGHQVAMCSGGGSFNELLSKHNVSVIEIDQNRKPVQLLKAFWGLYSFSKTWKPELIHAHMMTSGILAWPITRLLKIPLVTTVHNEFQPSSILMGLGDRVIAVSRVVKASMIKRGISEKRMRVVLNGTIGSARLPLPAPKAEILLNPSILFVGGLHHRKGIIELLQGFGLVSKAYPLANLYLVGEGPNKDDYVALAQTLGIISKVHFVGSVSDPRSYLKAADIFVLASHSDPAPLVISEAREAGCAIIASNVDGIPQLLDNGEAGILVPPKQPNAIAEALDKLLSDKDQLALYRLKSITNNQNLSVKRVSDETVKIYEECVYG